MPTMKLPRLTLACVALGATACATMMSGPTQKIRITSDPPDVRVTAEPGAYQTRTPGLLALPRKGGPYRLRFEKDGYQPVEVQLRQGTNGWLWGNLLIGGLIGIAVDFSTGAATTLDPGDVNVRLASAGLSRDDFPRDGLLVFARDGAFLAAVRTAE